MKTPSLHFPTLTFDPAQEGGAALSNFRGDGAHHGFFPVRINARPIVSWKSEDLNFGVHRASKATPAVDDDAVFVATDGGWLVAFDRKTKAILWKWSFPDSDRGLHSTPALDQKYIYFGTYRGRFYCLDKRSGEIMWMTQLGDAIGSSPVLTSNAILVGTETTTHKGYLVRLDKTTGRVEWVSETFHDQTHSSPAVDQVRNRIFVGDNAGIVHAVDMKDGKEIWSTHVKGPVKGTLALVDHDIFLGSWGGYFYALDGQDGSEIWRTSLKGSSQSSAAYSLKQDSFFILSSSENYLYAISRKSGEIIWEISLPKGRFAISSPVIVLDKKGKEVLVAGCSPRKLCFYDPQTGHQEYGLNISESLTGSIAPSNGSLFLSLARGGLVEIK